MSVAHQELKVRQQREWVCSQAALAHWASEIRGQRSMSKTTATHQRIDAGGDHRLCRCSLLATCCLLAVCVRRNRLHRGLRRGDRSRRRRRRRRAGRLLQVLLLLLAALVLLLVAGLRQHLLRRRRRWRRCRHLGKQVPLDESTRPRTRPGAACVLRASTDCRLCPRRALAADASTPAMHGTSADTCGVEHMDLAPLHRHTCFCSSAMLAISSSGWCIFPFSSCFTPARSACCFFVSSSLASSPTWVIELCAQ